MTEFWKSAGLHLVKVNDDGWLEVTPELLRAYFRRPELQPVAESCPEEICLYDDLIEDPLLEVSNSRLDLIKDRDASENYRTILNYRTQLVEAGTVEGAYHRMMVAGNITLPPLFIDQMVHLILRNLLDGCTDPLQLRTAELFFRIQNVNTDGDNVMLADRETVEMHARTKIDGSVRQFLSDSGPQEKSIELDVLTATNKNIYWQRSDSFDTVVDFRMGQAAITSFCSNLELWVKHFLGIAVKVQPLSSIEDKKWSWHIGLDRVSTRLLNALYNGEEISIGESQRMIALFRLDFEDKEVVIETVRNKPVYLGLAMTSDRQIHLKPQNLLTNLPLHNKA